MTAEVVRKACVDRNVINFEGHVDAMAQWLNSPEAVWAFLYLGETVRRGDAMARSPIFGDSGCCIFNNAGQKGISALTVIERDLRIQLNMIDCIGFWA